MEMRRKENKAGRNIKFKKRDLDLHCFIFDEDKQFVCEVSPEPQKLIDPSSSVYHSGDDYSGEGSFDDETIKLELNRLSRDYAHFFFVVTCDTKLTLAQCGEFRLHLYDPQSNKDLLLKKTKSEDGAAHASYIFCHLHKTDGAWDANPIESFGPYDRDWPLELAKMIP
jgi:stress response protein SCP2